MRLYTKTGDKGRTSLIGGRREKHDIRVEAYGTCDELNGFVGRAISLMDEKTFPDIKPELINIQHELFDCGSDLSNIRENADEITAKAEYFAKENGARELDDIIFPYENHFEIYVSVETETSFITVPDEAFPSGVRDLGTEASASIPLPNGVEFVPSSCH